MDDPCEVSIIDIRWRTQLRHIDIDRAVRPNRDWIADDARLSDARWSRLDPCNRPALLELFPMPAHAFRPESVNTNCVLASPTRGFGRELAQKPYCSRCGSGRMSLSASSPTQRWHQTARRRRAIH